MIESAPKAKAKTTLENVKVESPALKKMSQIKKEQH